MRESMKYITVEERNLYEKLAKQYNIKGYSAPVSIMSNYNKNKIQKGKIRKTESQELSKWISK